MYFPFRHDANANETMLNNSGASNLPESNNTARPYTSSFTAQSGSSPVFHPTGSIPGLHNVHGSYNMPTMPSSMSSRNPVGAVHQPSGSLQTGRFAANNLPTSLTQISHGGLHGHSGLGSRTGLSSGGSGAYSSSLNGTVTSVSGASPNSAALNNRAAVPGLGVSPSMIGGAGPRITNTATSMMSGAVGGGLGRTMNSGAGLSIPSFSGSRLGSNVSGLGMQGPGRPSNVLQQASPQMVSLLGSNFSNSLGSIGQGQVAAGNGQLSSMGLMSDGATNDGVAFDMNDFPQLSTRPSSGGSQGSMASLRKQVGVNPIVQQSQEFSIQNENFPALPGFKGGNSDFTALHQKDPQLENAFASVPSQQYAIGRSAGFSLGGSFVPHRQLQQQPSQHQGQHSIPASAAPGSFNAANTIDMLQMHSAAEAFQAQVGGPPGASSSHVPIASLRSTGNPTLTSYDQLAQQYQQQHNPSQFRLGARQQLAAMDQLTGEQGTQGLAAVDPFGLLGLLNVIRMSNHDLTTLALGTDLTTLGLDLNARDNLYKRFASPWAEGPAKGEPEFTLPQCYVHEAPPLQPGYFTKFSQGTLFYIFYSMPNDEAQLYAANELYNQGWFFHKDLRTWFARVPNVEPLVTTPTYERGSYYFFDANTWELRRKDHFVVQYDMMEKKPQLPQH
ncbi:hypothetical protein GOP47_0011480 [Adiantum capillus-veneris]|uniref:NOT2/NOT3/NOT5 C-terminal domain-containing protein n=1 Tax=Adiantum capillus-veneris TaxID=13818 RepID=A0A9D4UU45_ADICA|nr:hypothetical protein GOP47_0011480 [Adiantum capillus-veneris]